MFVWLAFCFVSAKKQKPKPEKQNKQTQVWENEEETTIRKGFKPGNRWVGSHCLKKAKS